MSDRLKPYRLIARALDGDRDALRATASLALPLLDRHRTVPALASRLRARGLAIPEAWRLRETRAAARWMALEATREEAGEALDGAGLAWLVFKGCDLADHYYPTPEQRPTSDLDVLVRSSDFQAGRRALEAQGWQGLSSDPRLERYRAEEGYAWPAAREGRPLLEVHFRLWGLMPAAAGDAIIDASTVSAGLRGTRPSPADAYLLAAVHHFLQPPPRQLIGLFDLETIARAKDDSLTGAVVGRAQRLDVALPVALAATHAARAWPRATHHDIAAHLARSLRWPERMVFDHGARRHNQGTSTAAVVLARLLAGRSSRAGWRTLPRRVWSHPGVVAAETPGAWGWPKRRWIHVLRRLGLGRQQS